MCSDFGVQYNIGQLPAGHIKFMTNIADTLIDNLLSNTAIEQQENIKTVTKLSDTIKTFHTTP